MRGARCSLPGWPAGIGYAVVCAALSVAGMALAQPRVVVDDVRLPIDGALQEGSNGAAQLPQGEAQMRWRETHRPWKILVFHAPRPHILALCKNVHRWIGFEELAHPDPADPLKARLLSEALTVNWAAGSFAQAGEPAPKDKLLTDACFALYIDDKPVLSGAVVSSFSARRFDFPALVVQQPMPEGPLRLTLAPRFPPEPEQPAPKKWVELLNQISGP